MVTSLNLRKKLQKNLAIFNLFWYTFVCIKEWGFYRAAQSQYLCVNVTPPQDVRFRQIILFYI